MKRVLVTGGAGYIGAHTVAKLTEAGYKPVIVDNLSRSDRTLLNGLEVILPEKLNFYQGDCLDKKFLTELVKTQGPFQGVLHFAAYKSVGESVQSPLQYYHNNVGSLITILEVMKECMVTDLIFSSSCTVYGQPDMIPVNESAPFKKAESPYGATKQMCEQILKDCHSTGFRIISLRYFNPIGAHPSNLLGELPIGIPNNLVPYITQTAIGKRSQLTVFGNDYNTPDGTCIRDFIHVVDVASAHVKAIQFLENLPPGNTFKAYNLGTGVGISVLQLIHSFEKIAEKKLNYTIGKRRPGDVEKTFADPSKANQELGWKTEFSIEEALLHAWKWENKCAGLALVE